VIEDEATREQSRSGLPMFGDNPPGVILPRAAASGGAPAAQREWRITP
jgi:hypothetical protein